MLIESKPVFAEHFFLSSHFETTVLIVEKHSSSMEFNLDLYATFNLDRKHFSLYLGFCVDYIYLKKFP